jgi:hypothetical protein
LESEACGFTKGAKEMLRSTLGNSSFVSELWPATRKLPADCASQALRLVSGNGDSETTETVDTRTMTADSFILFRTSVIVICFPVESIIFKGNDRKTSYYV